MFTYAGRESGLKVRLYAILMEQQLVGFEIQNGTCDLESIKVEGFVVLLNEPSESLES
jgi:hypothetical protein